MPVKQFTETFIRQAPLGPPRREYRDKRVTGLTLRIGSRSKVFSLTYYDDRGRLVRETLGPHGDRRAVLADAALSLERARAAALHRLAEVQLSKSRQRINAPFFAPAAPRQQRAPDNPLSLEEVLEHYVRHAQQRTKTWSKYETTMRNHVLPRLGADRAVHELTSGHIRKMFSELESDAGEGRVRWVYKVLRTVLNHAANHGLVESSPVSMPCPASTGTKSRRTRHLSPQEIRAFWETTSNYRRERWAILYLLRLTTAQREGSLRWINRAHIESEETGGAWWQVPAEITKTEEPHRVYLAPLTLQLLGRLEPNVHGLYFPSNRDPERALAYDYNAAAPLLKALRERGIQNFQLRDLRRTAATLMSKAGVSRQIVSRVLAHTDGSITAVYDLYSYDAEVRAATLKLEERLREIVGTL